jgi:hypothetical protein
MSMRARDITFSQCMNFRVTEGEPRVIGRHPYYVFLIPRRR